jgi:IclR family KDG regulon transcriptional repressor
LKSQYRLDTVQATLRLIDLFLESSDHEFGVSQISRELDLTKSQIYRILQNLAEHDWVQQHPDTRKYQLGFRFLFAGQVVQRRLDLLREAGTILDQLRDETDETVHLVIRREQEPMCIGERQSSHRLRFFADVGMRLPWHAGSASKLLLAYLPPAQQEQILSDGPLIAYTSNTITDPEQLRRELESICRDGYATSDAEMSIGTRAVAAPIRDHSGAVVATVSVVGPAERLKNERMPTVTQQVIAAARRISARFGFHERPGPG